MIDHRFFTRKGPLTIAQIAAASGATVVDRGQDLSHKILTDVSSLEEGGPSHLSFFHNAKYCDAFKLSQVGACFVSKEWIHHAPKSMICLETPHPQRCFGVVSALFYPGVESDLSAQKNPVHETAQIGDGTVIGYGAVVGAKAIIGANCRIGPNAVIGRGVVIGDQTVIGAGVSISHAIIGNQCIVYPGARIGQAGFGFAMDDRGFVTVPQLGRVILEDNVEIGANTTIDRGSLRDTVIGRGSRLDNLVMIGHNVTTGKDCVLVAQVGVAGSTQLGDQVIAAGQVGIVGHISIGNGVRIAAQSGVSKSIPPGQTVSGSPAIPISDHNRQIITVKKLCKDYSQRKKGTS